MTTFAVLEVLHEEERRRVLRASSRRRFARGEVLFHQGDPGNVFHLLDRGHVKVSVGSRSGDVWTLAVLGPGDFFGEQALLGGEVARTATVTALDLVQTRALAAADFHELRGRHPVVNDLLVHALAAQVRRLSDLVVEARSATADQRIARRLLQLCEVYRDSSVPVVIPLSQEELAQMAGTTRPTVSRFLGALGDAVVPSRGRITISDEEPLRRAS